jgi:preprotein translocase subunit SecY
MEEEKEPRYIKIVSTFLPAVVKPTFRQSLNHRIRWTGIVLALFLLLSHVTVYGLEKAPEVTAGLRFFEIVLGSRIGSIVSLGIGPIVTAGILLQLLVGSKIINWDTTKKEDREKFMFWNKFLAVLFCFIEAAAFAMGGVVPVAKGMLVVVIIQLAIGGILVILLDEIVSKWGFGSGVSLFIAAGVGTQLILSFISPFPLLSISPINPTNPGPFVGQLLNFFYHLFSGESTSALLSFLQMFFIGVIFVFVAYANLVRIDIPLAFGRLRGFGRIWSIRLFYTSVLPIILASALLANLQLIARANATPQPGEILCGSIGCFDQAGNIVWMEGKFNLIYYLSSPRGIIADIISGNITSAELLRAVTYTLFLTVMATIFSVFWVITSGMNAEAVAKQLSSSGLQIPGFRADERVMKSYLERYIQPLSVLSGILIGLLAAVTDLIGGATGIGTGILLLVAIIQNIYEQLRRERLEEMHPLIRRFVGE